MRRLGLGVSKVDWTKTFDFVMKSKPEAGKGAVEPCQGRESNHGAARHTLNPQPYTPNPTPYTLNPNPETLNTKPEALNPERSILNH